MLFVPGFAGENNSQTWDGSRTTPVHRIPLLDENNQQIIPTEPYPLPYSTRYTCAPCHDYDKIASGLHFSSGKPPDEAGRPGEPWFLIDQKSGTVLPVSTAGWPDTWSLEEAGLTAWSFTLHFGRHMTGGGTAEPGTGKVSPGSRWNVSGALEINCMGCHNASRIQSHSEWAKQVMRQNFRWAATAASAVGEVGGMASRLSSTWDIYDGPNLDDPVYAVVPSVKYDQTRFDSKHRVFFDIRRQPEDGRCLTCHSVSPVGAKKFTVDGDVHSVSGLKCVQCHRHGIDHNMSRGYEGETTGQDGDFSCRGCHSGKSRGRLGAPLPLHKGLPALHFEKLSCTVCHAGPLPGEAPARVRTSRVNRLGIYGVAQWSTQLPHIAAPVYKKDSGGKLTPHRLAWPAFWAQLAEGKVTPLPAEIIKEAGKDILFVEEKVAAILLTFMQQLEIRGEAALVVPGKVFSRSLDGFLEVSALPGEAARETFWAVKNKEKIEPLIPAFDTRAEQLDVEIETRITKSLEALNTLPEKPGDPVLVYKDKLYFLLEGYLESKNFPGKLHNKTQDEAAQYPQLCRQIKDKIIPLLSPFELRTIQATVGIEQSLTEEQVKLILKKFLDFQKLLLSETFGQISKPWAMGLNVCLTEVFVQLFSKSGRRPPPMRGLWITPPIRLTEKFVRSANFHEVLIKSWPPEGRQRQEKSFEYVYIANGKMFRLDEKGSLVAEEHEAAQPVAWPMAHDVRPARLALGAQGCADCHSVSSNFFFAKVAGTGPLKTDLGAVRSMHQFMGKDKYYQQLFGLSFTLRPLLKAVLFMALFFMAAILLLLLLLAVGRFTGLIPGAAHPPSERKATPPAKKQTRTRRPPGDSKKPKKTGE